MLPKTLNILRKHDFLMNRKFPLNKHTGFIESNFINKYLDYFHLVLTRIKIYIYLHSL